MYLLIVASGFSRFLCFIVVERRQMSYRRLPVKWTLRQGSGSRKDLASQCIVCLRSHLVLNIDGTKKSQWVRGKPRRLYYGIGLQHRDDLDAVVDSNILSLTGDLGLQRIRAAKLNPYSEGIPFSPPARKMKSSVFKFLMLGSGLLLPWVRVAASAAYPVCIVGAGPSGLTVAHELESRGVSTVIYDSNVEVGGKCQSYYDDPETRTTYHAMGALIFTNLTYSNTLPLILEAGLPLSPALSPGPSANWSYWQYSPGTDAGQNLNVTQTALPTLSEDALIALEVAAYTTLWLTEFQPQYTESRYPNGVPTELTAPMSEWLTSKGFQFLPVFVEEGLVYEGYGDFSQTPALYALQFLTPEILTYYIGTTPGYFVDFHKLWLWYAETYVSGPIYSSTNVTKIDRSADNPVVTYISAGNTSSNTQTCSSVVLAFPPTTRALEATGLDFTTDETSLFADVGVTAYWATAFNMSELPYPYAFLKNPPTPDFGPLAMLRYFNDSPIATAYSFGTSPFNESTSDSDEQVIELLLQTATDLGAGIANDNVGGMTTANTVTADDIKLFTRDHFPHVLTDALAGGFYKNYNALQGEKNTYWISGLNRFENVESAILSAKDLVANVMF